MRDAWVALGLAAATLAAGCGPYRASTVDLRGFRERRHATFHAFANRLLVRTDDPEGLVIAIFDPSLEGGRVVLNAGMTSSGGPGPHYTCLDVAPLAPSADWPAHLAWREPDGTLSPIPDVDQGASAAAAIAVCDR